jgi:uncharacterized membrane protein
LYNSINAQTPTPTAVPTPTLKGSISGTVTGKKSGNPMKGAKVSLKSKALNFENKTTTDTEGKFLFQDLNAGNYTLKVKKAGYENTKREIDLGEEENAVVDIQLKKEKKDDGNGNGGGDGY